MNTRDIAITALGASILVGGISYLFFTREDEDSKMLKKDRRARAELWGLPYKHEDEDDDYENNNNKPLFWVKNLFWRKNDDELKKKEQKEKLEKILDKYRGLDDDDDDSDLSFDSLLRFGGQKRKKTKKAMSRKKTKTKKGKKGKKGTREKTK